MNYWYYRHRRDNGSGGNDSGMGCLVMILLGLFALPLVGIYFMAKGNEDDKIIGTIMLIVGIVIWIMIGVQG